MDKQNRKDGVLEYWNIGEILFLWSSFSPLFHYSNFPLVFIFPFFHHSIIPSLTYLHSILNDSTLFILAALRAGRRPAPTEVTMTTSQDWIRLQTGTEN